jgi:hypothetical protein
MEIGQRSSSYSWICDQPDIFKAVATLDDKALRHVMWFLQEKKITTGIPGDVCTACLIAAATRFMKDTKK